MRLIEGSDLIGVFSALNDLKMNSRAIDPAVRAIAGAAVRDTLAEHAPAGASIADCMNDEGLMRRLAAAAIAVFTAKSEGMGG